jgi:hypothetical protein
MLRALGDSEDDEDDGDYDALNNPDDEYAHCYKIFSRFNRERY